MPEGAIEYDHNEEALYIVVDDYEMGPLDEEQMREVQKCVDAYFY